MRSAISILLITTLLHVVYSLYSPDGPVVLLTKDNFATEVISSPHVWVVEFFAPC